MTTGISGRNDFALCNTRAQKKILTPWVMSVPMAYVFLSCPNFCLGPQLKQEPHKQDNIRTFTNFGKKKLIGIPYSPVKWRDNRAKVDKILFILALQYKSLHIVLGSGGFDETKWKPGLFKTQ